MKFAIIDDFTAIFKWRQKPLSLQLKKQQQNLELTNANPKSLSPGVLGETRTN